MFNISKLPHKIWYNIKLYFFSLMYGMKATEDSILRMSGGANGPDSNINKEVDDRRISKALLRGEVTQEVEELRYRTYLVDKESREFNYYAPTLALRREKTDIKNLLYDNSDGLELITSQINDVMVEGVYDMLGQVGRRMNRVQHRIKIERNKTFAPRYRIEDYITRIDVKRLDDTHVILDMFVSIYPNDKDFKSKGFVREVEKIKDNGLRSDITELLQLSFVTSHAYKLPDLTKFTFTNLSFREVKEFDGHYILRFKAYLKQDCLDLTKAFYSKTMDEKYKNKEKKEVVLNFSDYIINEAYVCEECGKEVMYDSELIDKLEPYMGRDITDPAAVDENADKAVVEFLDMQIAEQTVGKKLCSECLKKYLVEKPLETNNIYTNLK